MKRDPYRELIDIEERMHRLLLDAFLRVDEREGAGGWAPPMDVYETNDAVVVIAEIPGLTTDDIDIRIDGGSLTLQGERHFGKNVREENYLRIERHYGKFSRTWTLPPSIDVDRVQADFKDGVLEVRLPKLDEEKPLTLKVPIG